MSWSIINRLKLIEIEFKISKISKILEKDKNNELVFIEQYNDQLANYNIMTSNDDNAQFL